MEIIKPNKLRSRPVNKEDLPRVMRDSVEMTRLCGKPLGIRPGAYAIAHCQVTDDDPLRFFVLKSGEIYINPEIISRSGKPVRRPEGCMSFANLRDVSVKRHEHIEVVFIDGIYMRHDGGTFHGLIARIFQHEIDHFDGKNIYNISN